MKTRKNFRLNNGLVREAQKQANNMQISLTKYVELALTVFLGNSRNQIQLE